MELTVKKQYHNGTEAVYECVNNEGVWIAVPVSMVVIDVRTRIKYSGNRDIEGVSTRSALVTITAKSEKEAELAHEKLLKLAHKYEAALCSNVEIEYNGTYTITEEFLVEDKQDFEYFKKSAYEKINLKGINCND